MDNPEIVVVVSGDPVQFDAATVTFTLNDNASDSLRVDNDTGKDIRLINDITPIGLSSKTPGVGGDLIPKGTTRKYTFTCPTDAGHWQFQVKIDGRPSWEDQLDVNVVCIIPTLTEWGIIILVLLLLATGTVAIVRKRRVVAR
jgi:hypothetical protein